MYITVGFCDFQDAFRVRKDNFSYEGLKTLYDYLEDFEESTGEKIELDVIAICCDYSEYENLEDFQSQHNVEDYETIEDIEKETTVIKVDNEKFIVQNF